MFGRRKKNAELTTYEKKKALSTNSVFAMIVGGILIYEMYQSYMAPDPMPPWFVVTMILMIAACGGLIYRNYRMIKKYDKLIAEEAALAEEAEEDDSENSQDGDNRVLLEGETEESNGISEEDDQDAPDNAGNKAGESEAQQDEESAIAGEDES